MKTKIDKILLQRLKNALCRIEKLEECCEEVKNNSQNYFISPFTLVDGNYVANLVDAEGNVIKENHLSIPEVVDTDTDTRLSPFTLVDGNYVADLLDTDGNVLVANYTSIPEVIDTFSKTEFINGNLVETTPDGTVTETPLLSEDEGQIAKLGSDGKILIECCEPPSSTPTIVANENGALQVTTENSCSDEGSIGRIELIDFDGDIVAVLQGDINTPVNEWNNEEGVLKDYILGTFNDFTIDTDAFASETIKPVQIGEYTIKTYINCGKGWSFNPDNFDRDCIDFPLFFSELIPISDVIATLITSPAPSIYPIGSTYHKEWRFVLGKNISGVIKSEQPLIKNVNDRLIATSNSYLTDNDSAIHLEGLDLATTITLYKYTQCFGLLAADFDNGVERFKNLDVLGSGAEIDIVSGAFNNDLYPDGTIKDVISTKINSNAYLIFNRNVGFKEIKFDMFRSSKQFGMGISEFKICNCNGIID